MISLCCRSIKIIYVDHGNACHTDATDKQVEDTGRRIPWLLQVDRETEAKEERAENDSEKGGMGEDRGCRGELAGQGCLSPKVDNGIGVVL